MINGSNDRLKKKRAVLLPGRSFCKLQLQLCCLVLDLSLFVLSEKILRVVSDIYLRTQRCKKFYLENFCCGKTFFMFAVLWM